MPLVVKVQPNDELFEQETMTMLQIDEASKGSNDSDKIPTIVDYGQLLMVDKTKIEMKNDKIELSDENCDLLSYVIMPKLGYNL